LFLENEYYCWIISSILNGWCELLSTISQDPDNNLEYVLSLNFFLVNCPSI